MQFFLQTNKFTDEDIRGVVKSFKMNFPQGNKWNWEILKKYNSLQNPWLAFPLSIIPTKNIDIFSKGNINKKATVELIRRIFPRFWIAFQKFFILIHFFPDLMPIVWWRTSLKSLTAKTPDGWFTFAHISWLSFLCFPRWPATRYSGCFRWQWTDQVRTTKNSQHQQMLAALMESSKILIKEYQESLWQKIVKFYPKKIFNPCPYMNHFPQNLWHFVMFMIRVSSIITARGVITKDKWHVSD